MKTQKCISILSLAVPGLFFGTSEALALPLPDLAGFAVLGASTESQPPGFAGDVADGHSDTVRAIAAINASPASSGPVDPMNGAQQGVGSVVRELAKTLRTSTRDSHDIAQVSPWAVGQASRPATVSAPVFCNDVSTPNNPLTVATVMGIVAYPLVGWPVQPTDCVPGDRIAGELTEDLAQALVQANLPLDPVVNTNNPEGEASAWPIQSSTPDIETAPAAFPMALVGDELAATLPEPATLALLAIGLAGIGCKRKSAA